MVLFPSLKIPLLPVLKTGFQNVHLDDMFITLRYARNFATGQGMVYNVGEIHYGFTSPLHFMVMSLVYFICPNSLLFPKICIFLGCINIWVLSLIIYWIGKATEKTSWAIIAGTLVLMSGHLYATSGLDVVWCLTLGMAALLASLKNRRILAAIILGLATLTRPDAVILAGIIFGFNLLRHRKIYWPEIFVYAFIVALWHGFAWSYFGHFLPQTLGVKIHQGKVATHFSSTLLFPWTYSFHYFPHKYGFILAPFGLHHLIKRERCHPFTFFTLWAVLHIVLYFFVLKVPTDYPWYYGYLTLAYMLLMAAGLPIFIKWLFSDMKDIFSARPKQMTGALPAWKPGVIYGGIFCLLLIAWTGEVKAYHRGRPWLYYYSPTNLESRTAGQWLKENVPNDAVVTAVDIGAFGYYSENYIFDLCELVHNQKTRTKISGNIFVLRMYEGWKGVIPDYLLENGFNYFKDFHHLSFPPAVIFSKNDVFQGINTAPNNTGN